ncbi:MAG: hypothetical protein DI570_31475, partial [Phenylobacterium zucineum]
MTQTTPNRPTLHPAGSCPGEDHGRWAKILIDWCLSRTPTSLERRDGGHWYILGAERAAAANALPRQILADIDASPEHYAPSDAALVAMFDKGLRHLGHRWDPITEIVQLTNPIRALRIPSMRIIHLFDTADSYHDLDNLWDEDDCRRDWPEVEPVDCDWRIEDEFSPEGRLSLYTDTLDHAEPEPVTRPMPRPTRQHRIVAEPAGDIGQTVTVTGTVITGRLPANRWNAKARALLILQNRDGRVKTVTSAAWAYRITAGQQLTLTGTITGHTTSHGQPLTILARPRPDTPPAAPPAPEDAAPVPPVWEEIRPARGKARRYPTRPTHWPRRQP